MNGITRREALGVAAAGVAAAIGTGAATPAASARGATSGMAAPPPTELVNLAQFEEQARLVLAASEFDSIAGGDREPFERLTLHPRLGEPALDMDLTARILGEELYTPIIVGPMGLLGRYHTGAESEAIKGAEASFTLTVLSSQSTQPIGEIAAAASRPFWFNVYASQSDAVDRARAAVAAGAT